jgi:hypothetical protein
MGGGLKLLSGDEVEMGEGRVLFGEQRRWKGGIEDI